VENQPASHALVLGRKRQRTSCGADVRFGGSAGTTDSNRLSGGGSAWESNQRRTLILKDLRRFWILPILRFLSFAAVDPQIAPSEVRA
jgi:hypothetical protein